MAIYEITDEEIEEIETSNRIRPEILKNTLAPYKLCLVSKINDKIMEKLEQMEKKYNSKGA